MSVAVELDAIVAVVEADASMRLYGLLAADVPDDPTLEALLQAIARWAWVVGEMPEMAE